MDETAVSDPINLREFLAGWRNLTTDYDLSLDDGSEFTEYVSNEMQISGDMVTDLESECRPSTLVSERDPKDNHSLLHSVPTGIDLLSLQLQAEELELRKADVIYKNKALEKMKYRSRDGPWKHRAYNQECFESNEQNEVKGRLVTGSDLFITVQVYRPYSRKRAMTLDQEFEVLGQQLLTDLRDNIYCFADFVPIGDFNQNPDHPCDILAKDLYKSGFFYIEGVFYNDMRDGICRDYSKVVVDWSKDKSHGVGPFQTQLMDATRFIDLTLRIGQPYLYLHEGDCEHIVIFSDIRMTHKDDCHHLDKYPILTYKSRERKPKCRVCQQHLARWVTYGSPLTPEDPCFFCDTCFRALHYNNDDKMLVSDIKVYPYPDSRRLTSSFSNE